MCISFCFLSVHFCDLLLLFIELCEELISILICSNRFRIALRSEFDLKIKIARIHQDSIGNIFSVMPGSKTVGK